MRVLTWFSLAWSAIGLFLSSWIVVPAPTFSLLPLGVGAPEISPLLLLGNALGLGLLLQRVQSRRAQSNRAQSNRAQSNRAQSNQQRRLLYPALVASLCALLLSSLPLLQLPATLQQADTQMQSTFGPEVAIPQGRPRPVSLGVLVTGLPIPEIQPERQQFAAADGTPLDLEIYRPGTGGTHPALITIYGGAWRYGDPSQHAAFNAYMAGQGYGVVAIDYRHAPQHRFPAQIQDVQAALGWVTERADQYGIDPQRIGLVGWSAGAHLALLAAYQSAYQSISPSGLPVRAVVGYYGPTDLAAGYADPPWPDPINTRAVLRDFIGGPPDQYPEMYQIASPVHHVKPALPPTLLIYGQRDHLVKPVFGQKLFDLLQASQNRAVLIALPWAEHAFDAVFRGLGNQISLYYTEQFLASTLGEPAKRAGN